MRTEISTVLTFGFSIGAKFLEVSVKTSCQPSDLHVIKQDVRRTKKTDITE